MVCRFVHLPGSADTMENQEKYTMKDLPVQERPYEKCIQHGAESLSNAELLAVILRTGTGGQTALELAYELLQKFCKNGSLCSLQKLGTSQLCTIKGIGQVKAIQIQCILEFARRLSKSSKEKGIQFQTAASVAEYYMEELRHCDQEQVLLLMLNVKGRLIAEQMISKGTVNQSIISPREIFMEGLKHNAVYIILLHNHPSGEVTPSQEDYQLTKRVENAGHLIGIELIDHIIIGDHSYYSFREDGKMD